VALFGLWHRAGTLVTCPGFSMQMAQVKCREWDEWKKCREWRLVIGGIRGIFRLVAFSIFAG
jgi:hypothetical protein